MGITDFVPKETSEQISQFADDAQRPADELAEPAMAATEMPGFLKPETESFQGQMGVGVDNKVLADAINNRALRGYMSNMGTLKGEIQKRAIESRFNRLQNAAKLVNAEHQQNERARMNKYLEKMNRKRARAGVLGNILGIGGAIGGAMVGGPAGAMAGYQIGQGVGQVSAG